MAMRQDTGGAILSHVTREVLGDIKTIVTVFDEAERKNVRKSIAVVEPVIIFFPNKSVLVMAKKKAKKAGYLSQPDILNFEAVTTPGSIAGKYKFAMSEQDRKIAWNGLEQHVISLCMQKGGYPLPRDVNFSDVSLWTGSKAGNYSEADEENETNDDEEIDE